MQVELENATPLEVGGGAFLTSRVPSPGRPRFYTWLPAPHSLLLTPHMPYIPICHISPYSSLTRQALISGHMQARPTYLSCACPLEPTPACIWHAYGMQAGCILSNQWASPCMRKLHAQVTGMHMACIWYAYGMHMVCIWHAYGMHMACIWYAYGMHMV